MNLTGPELEDRAAALAARFTALGIVADPGRFGGVVLYPTAEQAATLLWALDRSAAVMPPTPAHPDPERAAAAARQQGRPLYRGGPVIPPAQKADDNA